MTDTNTPQKEYRFEIIETDRGALEKGDRVVRFPDGDCIMEDAMPAAVDELNKLLAEVRRLTDQAGRDHEEIETLREAMRGLLATPILPSRIAFLSLDEYRNARQKLSVAINHARRVLSWKAVENE